MIYARMASLLAAGIVTVAVAGCQDNGSDLNRTGANSTYNSNYGAGSSSYNDRNAAYNGSGMNSNNSENTAGSAGSGAGQTESR
jgi:hypothetical protein